MCKAGIKVSFKKCKVSVKRIKFQIYASLLKLYTTAKLCFHAGIKTVRLFDLCFKQLLKKPQAQHLFSIIEDSRSRVALKSG